MVQRWNVKDEKKIIWKILTQKLPKKDFFHRKKGKERKFWSDLNARVKWNKKKKEDEVTKEIESYKTDIIIIIIRFVQLLFKINYWNETKMDP